VAIDPEDLIPRKTAAAIVPGEDLSTLSEHELTARIAVLEGEIGRCRAAIAARQETRKSADGFFKR
jgi:uncharacterized small protein (DUF1192 family)